MAKGAVIGQGEASLPSPMCNVEWRPNIVIANQRPRQRGRSERRAEPTVGAEPSLWARQLASRIGFHADRRRRPPAWMGPAGSPTPDWGVDVGRFAARVAAAAAAAVAVGAFWPAAVVGMGSGRREARCSRKGRVERTGWSGLRGGATPPLGAGPQPEGRPRRAGNSGDRLHPGCRARRPPSRPACAAAPIVGAAGDVQKKKRTGWPPPPPPRGRQTSPRRRRSPARHQSGGARASGDSRGSSGRLLFVRRGTGKGRRELFPPCSRYRQRWD